MSYVFSQFMHYKHHWLQTVVTDCYYLLWEWPPCRSCELVCDQLIMSFDCTAETIICTLSFLTISSSVFPLTFLSPPLYIFSHTSSKFTSSQVVWWTEFQSIPIIWLITSLLNSVLWFKMVGLKLSLNPL